MGRVAGVKHKPKVMQTHLTIKTIRLKASESFPDQLKAFREILGISGVEMAKKLDLAPSNIHHFETQNATKNAKRNPFRSQKNTITETAIRYAKALGATKIEIIL